MITNENGSVYLFMIFRKRSTMLLMESGLTLGVMGTLLKAKRSFDYALIYIDYQLILTENSASTIITSVESLN